MITQNQNSITMKVCDTENFTFNTPDIGDNVILLPNPYSKSESRAIIVVNRFLQQMGFLPNKSDFNTEIENILKEKPLLAEVIDTRPKLLEVMIEIKIKKV